MDLRSRRSRSAETSEERSGPLGSRTKASEKVDKWRKKMRMDPDNHERMKAKDRERKRQKRKEAREKALNDQRQLEELRKRKREEVQKYRAKKRGKKNDKNTKAESLKQNKAKRELSVKRTQLWRMKIKLKEGEYQDKESHTFEEASTSGTCTPKQKSSSFSSKWSKNRTIKKVKNSLPNSPRKKAEVLEKLLDSPRTSKVLEQRGANLLTKQQRKRLQMSTDLASAIKQNLTETKGPDKAEKRHGHLILANTVLQASKAKGWGGSYAMKKHFGLKLQSKAKLNWWRKCIRKKRKDALNIEAKTTIKSFYLSPEISTELPSKKDVINVRNEDGQKNSLQKQIKIV